MKIGIIIGSIRDGRVADSVGDWVTERAAGLTDRMAEEHADRESEGTAEAAAEQPVPAVDWEPVDLRELDLPLLTSIKQAHRDDAPAGLRHWRETVDSCDGFVFITPEYNRAMPGAFKNAFDLLAKEWTDKTVGFVSYGGNGGIRAVDVWRQSIAPFNMLDVGSQTSLLLRHDFEHGELKRTEHHDASLEKMLIRLVRLTAAVRN